MGDCSSCLVLDDELNVLPISKGARGLKPLPGRSVGIAARPRPSTQMRPWLSTHSYCASHWGSRLHFVWWMGAGSLDEGVLSPAEVELRDLKASLQDMQPLGSLVGLAKTVDQAKAVIAFMEAVQVRMLAMIIIHHGMGREREVGAEETGGEEGRWALQCTPAMPAR